ncbi:MAG: histidinol dehydrogenase [Planctomycetota bacterium]
MALVIQPDDPRLRQLLVDAEERFARLVAEAEAAARPFYERVFGQALGIDEALERIFAEVAAEGDEAVARYNRLFDGCELPAGQLLLGPDDFAAAWQTIPDELRAALATATGNIERYQTRLLPAGFGADGDEPLGVRWVPLERVGAYAPGGTGGALPLCSTVLMDLVPARVAGVDHLVLATPPGRDGRIAPELLAACHAAGVHTLLRAGGVQAIAALACGTATLPRVDKIVGPGNIYVTLAKRFAYGRVDIDMLAGPSEVLVIADDSCDPAWVAADALSQCEHDELATSIVCAIGGQVADAIAAELDRQCAALPEERRRVARASLDRFGCVVACDTTQQAVSIANRFAPEHLELLVREPQALLPELRHAGAIFIGPWSPEPIGDYVAGPSHTLPTGGTARMWSGIGADTFLRRCSVIALDEAGFRAQADAALALARAEGLEAHARSISVRLERR